MTRPQNAVSRIVLALALLLAATPPAPAQDDTDEPIIVREILVLDGVVRSRRSPVLRDPIEAAFVAGTFAAPNEGDEVQGGRRTRTWRKMADENGSFGGRGLGSGYAFATVESPRERVMLLEARGHRHAYVNGEPRGGDVYNLGLVRWPVALRAGTNELLFRGGRGNLQIRLVPPPAPVFLESRDVLLPHVIKGEERPLWGMVQVTNATNEWQSGLYLRATTDSGWRGVNVPPIGPASAARVAFRFSPPRLLARLRLELLETSEPAPPLDLGLSVKAPDQKHVRTFRSAIDGSVQAYGVTPPKDRPDGPLGLVLSLHGAGVDGRNQAHHYRPTDWAYIVSPTNRRPFGFDWEDWGRWDALEALSDAQRRFGTDPRYTVLTGHSMGGHGTWQLGVHFPGLFAAIGPSAGWRDFWSYAGAADVPDESDAVSAILLRAVNGSRTTLLERNLEERGVYVLHGANDNNVPVGQARFMRQRLGEFHPNFVYYERPGAGHWWGDQCMDWPPLMEFLRRNTPLPADREVRRVELRTVHPSISSKLHWITIEAQGRDFEVSRVAARLEVEERELEIETENVSQFYVDVDPLARSDELDEEESVPLAPGQPVGVGIDGQDLGILDWPGERSPGTVVPSGVYRFARTGDRWSVAGRPSARRKGPHRTGPFKDAFRNDVLLVAGTAGDDAEDAWAYAKARHDAETFAYRGNGAFEILRDVDVDLKATRDRNLVLYGNADTHALWDELIGDCPVTIRRGAVTIGEQVLEGDDLGCLLIFPKKGSEIASVGVVAGTGPAGQAVTNQLPYFVSGIAYPDWVVIGSDMLETGFEGVRAAGFFAADWSLGDDWAIRPQAQQR